MFRQIDLTQVLGWVSSLAPSLSALDYSSLYAPIEAGNFLYQDDAFSSETHTQADMRELMAKPETTWQLLASGIPELSFAAGSNRLEALTELNAGEERNFNLHDYRVEVEGSDGGQIYWPVERVKGEDDDLDWKHSDMIGIAYPYLQPFYQRMITLISE